MKGSSVLPLYTGQLRHSYLGISTYIRERLARSGIHTQDELQHPACRSRKFHCSTSCLNVQNNQKDKRAFVPPTQSPQRARSKFKVQEENASTSDELLEPKCRTIVEAFQSSSDALTTSTDSWAALDRIANSPNSQRYSEKIIQVHGYITSVRRLRDIHFVQLVDPSMRRAIQMVLNDGEIGSAKPASHSSWRDFLKEIQPHTPVIATGRVVRQGGEFTALISAAMDIAKFDPFVGNIRYLKHADFLVNTLEPLNKFPKDIVDVQPDRTFPPTQRYLEYRTNAPLRDRIRFRSDIKNEASRYLQTRGFQDIETPILFKSTPEGAREFVVPTRQQGLAYALPQSPQQYKQILMASGVPKYFQFARCFRDEDLRADRQPEFTQLDIEMAFADSKAVMSTVEELILKIIWPFANREQHLPVHLQASNLDPVHSWNGEHMLLPILTYQEAMSKYGSDKPDLRYSAQIMRVENWLPSSLKRMLTSIEDPIVDMFKLSLGGNAAANSRKFVADFMKLPSSAQFTTNVEGMPGIALYDAAAPLRGLATFGHEAAAKVEELLEPESGDVIVAQARSRQRLSGGSTVIGRIRNQLHDYAVSSGILKPPEQDSLLWVVDFPLFSPTEEDTPGQEGSAGICATHHPFTAPKSGQDLSNLISDPLSIIGDHYDLVINGYEIGGGSRRIHQADMQRLIFSEVLRMSPEKIQDFQHLLDALHAGCPPHAGFALGFDRLVALLKEVGSVRDVIAFPKYHNGEDPVVKSPSRLTSDQLKTYHLQYLGNR